MKHKHHQWFWGIFFVAAAVLVVLSQVTAVTELGFWPIVAGVVLAAIFIQSLIHFNYFGIFLSLALGYIILQHPLHFYLLSPWLLLLAAVLLSIGFYTMFHHRPRNTSTKHHDGDTYRTIEDVDDNNPSFKVSFGACSKYLHSDNLKSGQFYCNFGSLEVYFDQVRLDPTGADIFLDCSLGAMVLYIPRAWRVIDRLHTSMSAVKDDAPRGTPSEDAPVLTLTGNVSMGSVEIHYV